MGRSTLLAMDLQTELFRVTEALAGNGVDYALCGGIAVVIHGFPRLTRDFDILIRRENLDQVREAVATVGFTLESGAIRFDAGEPRERELFRVTKAEGKDFLILDLILVGPGLQDVFDSRERHRIGEREVHVVSRSGLRTMKRAAARPKDLEDLRQLGLEEDS